MKIPNDVISILNRDSALTMRIYPMFEAILEESKHDIEYFINKSAIIVHSWSLGMYAEDPDHLSPLFAKIPRINNIFLNGIPTKLLPLLEDSFPKIIVSDPCHIWTLESPPSSQPPLESLNKADALFIDKNWTYHSDDSFSYISYCIENNLSSVIRDEERTPVGWAFSYSNSPYHVNMGGLLVLPPFRRQGYARKITIDLSTKIFQSGKKPLVHVHTTNYASHNLLKSIGFTKGEEVFFGRIQFEESSSE
ncbi:MAG: GNAT family N-acetyltransferase [Candidatus Hodarchaeales archaeon]